MREFWKSSGIIGLILSTCAPIWGADLSIKLEFSGKTVEENQVTLQGAGFGQYPQADVAFGYIPTDNAFEGATDGQGVIVTAKPGQGVMVFAPKIVSTDAALVRISVRTDSPNAAITLATVGEKPDVFIATNTPSNEAYFQNQFLRLAVFCLPPSGGFQPLVQVMNTSATETLTAYLDNFEVISIDRYHYFHGEFLNGDETDPPANEISLKLDGSQAAFPSSSENALAVPMHKLTVCMDLVRISDNLFMGKYEVTQEQWETVMGNNPSHFKGSKRPVEMVSYNDCVNFIQTLNNHLAVMNYGTFRLPTYAEWWKACYAGKTTKYFWGNDDSEAANYAWYSVNSGKETHDVGTKKENALGLYDICGNVSEWCTDALINGVSSNVLCGGSWGDLAYSLVAPIQGWEDEAYSQWGFRVVLERN